MDAVAVISASGKKLMPTNSRRARKLLRSKKAVVLKYRPIFTIKMVDRMNGDTQPIEYKCDTGYQHIGVSICSQKHEFVNEQRDMLKNEPERHNDCRKYRRTRRNRLRYRKPRWNNRKGLISRDGFAPSIRNKRDLHVNLYKSYCAVMPITIAVIEIGQFDTQVLKAFEEGKPLPVGVDYQRGEQYGYATLREAVFSRDNYTCICCGRSAIKHHAILKMHHLGYRIGDRSNRMSNLATVCDHCHTSKNHQKGGKLYDLKPKLKSFKGATFMTMVRWDMLRRIEQAFPDIQICMTYGAATKLARKDVGIKKTHSNDAYCMGAFHPKHRCDFKLYEKRRRNNRVLSKFYDAKVVDVRTGKVVKGSQLGCERTNRRELRNSPKSLRKFRGETIKHGYTSTRTAHYAIQPGDIVRFNGISCVSKGCHCKGTRALVDGKSVALKKIDKVVHAGGWMSACTESL